MRIEESDIGVQSIVYVLDLMYKSFESGTGVFGTDECEGYAEDRDDDDSQVPIVQVGGRVYCRKTIDRWGNATHESGNEALGPF